MASSTPPEAVADTVVLLYFLLTGEMQLLLDLLGRPIGVPTLVFDTSDVEAPEAAQSEVRRSIRYYEKRSRDPALGGAEQAQARTDAGRLMSVEDHVQKGEIVLIDLDVDELDLVADLIDQHRCVDYDLIVPLGPGEAACVAAAVKRPLVLATDDSDALKVYARLGRGRPYERIRKLLVRAADEDVISRERANQIHAEMRAHGFWDSTAPFPS